MKTKSLLFSLCALIFFLIAGCCPRNPDINMAITAHGNTDWHIDTAEEFLLGTDMGGNPSAANHCPDSWTKRHMHVGLTNTNHFYYDADLTTPGDDTDTTNGIDRAMLFFYAGHGSPDSFDTLGNAAEQQYMALGDCEGTEYGLLRYYWQCSCKVFAHGPYNCTSSTFHYGCPQDFDGSADSVNMRNVYERWGPVLEPELRMACGSSTLAWCHEGEMNSIWDNYNNNSFDVADSFIDGLQVNHNVVPLCITRGGFDVTKTPLYDQTFTNQPNDGGSYYHIQFLSQFATTAPIIAIPKIPEHLPIYEFMPPPLPDPLRQVKFVEMKDFLVSQDEVKDRGPRVRVSRISGSVYIRGDRKTEFKKRYLKEGEYIEQAMSIIRKQGWTEKDFRKPQGVRLQIQTMPIKSKEDIQHFQKNVIVKIKRQITVDGLEIPVLGRGGVMTIQMNNDGTLLNSSKIWRQIVGIKKKARVKSYKQAYNEAIEKLQKHHQAYKLDRWIWGYKEAPGNMKQDELRIVFFFEFLPINEEMMREHPPRRIEIPGHID
jgi:hypothetical protein